MKRIVLKNGINLVYKEVSSQLTSTCIALNGGACQDTVLGIAHATEHMLYKGTGKRTEADINKELSEIFGFQNAMTNYPYVMYYGTSLNEDFEKGIELFSDILMSPIFPNKGFKEEMDVIKEELKEWDEDIEQFCEDKLFLNSFNESRLKHPIIGTEKSLQEITLVDIKSFYNKIYNPSNITISIVTDIEFNTIVRIIENYFGMWIDNKYDLNNPIYEHIEKRQFIDSRQGFKTATVEIIAPINNLTMEEIKGFQIFNEFFGEGVNSILFDTLRTKNGLVYDVLTKISNEEYIKLYKITFNTSKDKVFKALNLINNAIESLDILEKNITNEDIQKLVKKYKLKRLFNEEKGIALAKELAVNKFYIDEGKKLEGLTKEFIFKVGKKVLDKYSIEIISD